MPLKIERDKDKYFRLKAVKKVNNKAVLTIG
jgi:hypothetical protein